jgi:hypothetical protein
MPRVSKGSGTSKSGNAKVSRAAAAVRKGVAKLNRRADQQPHGAKNAPAGPGRPKGV